MKTTIFSGLLAAVTLAVFATQSEASGLEQPTPLPARRHHAKNEMMRNQKRGQHFSGKATWYGMHPGDLGACGGELNSNDFIVALNEQQYGNLNAQSSYCGKTITITNGQKTAQATIADACPTGVQCHFGALDMSRSLFSYFNDFSVGVFDIEWWVDGSGGSGGSSSSSNNNNNDDDSNKSSSSSSSKSSNDDDESSSSSATSTSSSDYASEKADAAKARVAQQQSEAKKEAAQKKKEAEEAAAKKKAAAEKKQQEEKAAAEKKKEEAEKKKKEAAKKAAAAKKAKEQQIEKTQKQNLAAFGQIMETLNDLVTEAAGPVSASISSAASSASSAVSSASGPASLPTVSAVVSA